MTAQPQRNRGAVPFLSSSFPPDPDSVAALLRAGESWANACLAWQAELARFTATRWQADLDLSAGLCRCRDLADLLALQQTWLAAAAEGYAAEAGQLAEMAGRAVCDGVACWRKTGPAAGRPPTASGTRD